MRNFRRFLSIPSRLMPSPLMRLRYMRNRDGITAVEFALIAPVLLTLISGIIELSLIFFVQNVMEAAVSNTARLGKTGFTTEDKSQQETIRSAMQQYTAGLLDPFQLNFTYVYYNSFNDIGKQNKGTSGLGAAGQIVVYTVSYPWHILTPIMPQIIGDQGIFTISSRIVVKNEPYD